MLKSCGRTVIRLKGVRHNNLKGFDLDLTLNKLTVVTGLSGSGKSSLAFDTLFAEGQRRYIETFSPYARQFLDRMDKPHVDSIEGIPPAIAIEQRNAVRTTRSTVGTMTELCEYMKMLWPHIARLHCRQCGQPVRKDSPQSVWSTLLERPDYREKEILITFTLPLTEKLSLTDSLALIAKQGYQRLLLDGKVARLEEAASDLRDKQAPLAALTIVQDRLRLSPTSRPRFIEACEQAYHFGKGLLCIRFLQAQADSSKPPFDETERFSNRLHCARCDIDYREPSPALFSFNHPLGACPKCRGFGRVISIDYDLAIPDRSRTLAQGVVKPWLTGQGIDCQKDMLRMCKHYEIRTDVPFERLSNKWQKWIIEGDPEYGSDDEHEWPRAWYGVKGYFRWLESKAYKMHVRVLLSRYRAYTTCPDCHGQRFQPDALLYRAPLPRALSHLAEKIGTTSPLAQTFTLADFYELPIRDAVALTDSMATSRGHKSAKDPLKLALTEVRSRLGYLNDIGLGYLTLSRPTRSLSGGETERVNLTTCLGTCLVNTLFVLDEPSVGLHPRDTERLIHILHQLRDAGNTVVVVEHEPSVMRAADQIIDLGPGHGASGGQVVFQGTVEQLLKSNSSLTGQYLAGEMRIETPERRPVRLSEVPSRDATRRSEPSPLMLNDRLPELPANADSVRTLRLEHASLHNLKDLSVEIPLQRFVCVTGVSGSGKTTLIRELLLPALLARLGRAHRNAKASERITPADQNGDEENPEASSNPISSLSLEGAELVREVVLVDQSSLGKTPRSNPAVYIGAFDDIRELFGQSEAARQRGLNASAFSFNSSQGQCERCRGAGFEKIEMQFLSDVFIRCPECNGKRYRSHILEVKIGKQRCSIGDVLEATVDEAIDFLSAFTPSRAAKRAGAALSLLQEVGLGYLKLGQPINTLSGGESQRLKLVTYLAAARNDGAERPAGTSSLFLFDEPTTGLHFDDVRLLLKVFQRLVDRGDSVLVIEHNLDVIKCADWVIDLGPDAGDQGGQLVAQGTPEEIIACGSSHTGKALLGVLGEAARPYRARRFRRAARRLPRGFSLKA